MSEMAHSRPRRQRGLWAAVALLAVAAVLAVHNVPAAPTEEDIVYTERILAASGYEGPTRGFGDLEEFDSQIRAIRAVQDSVLAVAKGNEEIPFDQPREPRDAYEQRKGLCYDRSRAIEKMLAVLGFEIRHVSVYETHERPALLAVLTPGNGSHALTEVRTGKGWMAVDPINRWIGLTRDGRVLDVASLRTTGVATGPWAESVPGKPHSIFRGPFVLVRGLYSRHGRFFPPYTAVPDVNWRQLLTNFGA